MSSIYRPICLSHSPALVLPAIEGPNSPPSAEHTHCDLVIGRWSGGLIELGCVPRTTALHPNTHANIEWMRAKWLRLLYVARLALNPDDLHPDVHPLRVAIGDIDPCWSPTLLARLSGLEILDIESFLR